MIVLISEKGYTAGSRFFTDFKEIVDLNEIYKKDKYSECEMTYAEAIEEGLVKTAASLTEAKKTIAYETKEMEEATLYAQNAEYEEEFYNY